MTPAQRRAETIRQRRASEARMTAAREATLAAVRAGKCPVCGRKVKRNTSLAGWYQCEQFGAVGFRADANALPCNWQGFTE